MNLRSKLESKIFDYNNVIIQLYNSNEYSKVTIYINDIAFNNRIFVGKISDFKEIVIY